jgi:diguanylate cyclase (GGDEF)-like protein
MRTHFGMMAPRRTTTGFAPARGGVLAACLAALLACAPGAMATAAGPADVQARAQAQVRQLQQEVRRLEELNDLLLAGLLAGLLAAVGYGIYKVRRERLSSRTLAETDALTGISNRPHFNRLVEAALAHCARSDDELGFVMFDLDNFRIINERYGHDAGDWVLRTVAGTCRTLCRKDDHLGRIGGEEFAILLLDCELDAAEKMARACCDRIAAIDTASSGHVFTISASFGVTSAGLAGNDFQRLLAQADQAMYRAKSEGRNRVVVHTLAARVPEPQP